MNDLHSAYSTLGLEPGQSIEVINRAYKKLVKTWHPDKFADSERKRQAEEKLKKINHAKDLLKGHFGSRDHKQSGFCDCRPQASGQSVLDAQADAAGRSGPGRTESPRSAQQEQEAAKESTEFHRGDRAGSAPNEKERAGTASGEHAPEQKPFARSDHAKQKFSRFQLLVACAATFGLLVFVHFGDGGQPEQLSFLEDLFSSYRKSCSADYQNLLYKGVLH